MNENQFDPKTGKAIKMCKFKWKLIGIGFIILSIFFFIIAIAVTGTSMSVQKELEQKESLFAEAQSLKDSNETFKTESQSKDDKINQLTSENATLNSSISDLNATIDDLNAKIAEAQPWFDKTADEKQALIDEQAAVAAAAQQAEQQAAEEIEKQGYNTGITYDQIARTPDDYIGKKVKFSGTVIQVIEGSGTIAIRFAVNDDYNNIILASYNSSIVSQRVLEDDVITIYGTSTGLYTYESTMGGEITVPSVFVDKIDF